MFERQGVEGERKGGERERKRTRERESCIYWLTLLQWGLSQAEARNHKLSQIHHIAGRDSRHLLKCLSRNQGQKWGGSGAAAACNFDVVSVSQAVDKLGVL